MITDVFQNGVTRASLESAQCDYDECRGVRSGCDDASRHVGAADESYEGLPEQEVLWNQAANNEDMLKKGIASARKLIQALLPAVPVTKNLYV